MVLLQYKVARIFSVVLVCCNVIAFGFWVVARVSKCFFTC